MKNESPRLIKALPGILLFLLPVLEGQKDVLHKHLFWSEGGGTGEWAVRSGDWKLVVHKVKIELFDLKNDVSESTDLLAKHPDIVKKLSALYDSWLDEMAEPMKEPGKRWVPAEQ